MRFNDEPYGSKQCMGPVAAAIPAIIGAIGTAGPAIGGISSLLGAVNAIRGPQKQNSPSAPTAAPVAPLTKPGAVSRPDSLSTLAGYAPDQERTFLATKGTQGGLGKDEDTYYKNLIQRSLIGDDNSPVTGGVDDYLKPVESQYFTKQGANESSIDSFLKSIRGY